jgi:hypothetical protein
VPGPLVHTRRCRRRCRGRCRPRTGRAGREAAAAGQLVGVHGRSVSATESKLAYPAATPCSVCSSLSTSARTTAVRLTMTMPHMSMRKLSHTDGRRRFRITLLAGCPTPRIQPNRVMHCRGYVCCTSKIAYGKKNTVSARRYCASVMCRSGSRLYSRAFPMLPRSRLARISTRPHTHAAGRGAQVEEVEHREPRDHVPVDPPQERALVHARHINVWLVQLHAVR